MSDPSRREALRKLTEMAIEDGSYGEAAPEMRPEIKGYCPECGRGDCAPSAEQWRDEQREAQMWKQLQRIALMRISRVYGFASLYHEGECSAIHSSMSFNPKCWACRLERHLELTPAELEEIDRLTKESNA